MVELTATGQGGIARNARPQPRRWSLDTSFLGRATAVVRQWGHVFNRLHCQPGGLQRGDCRFPTGSGSLDADLDFLQAELGGTLSGRLGGALRGKWGALAAALESYGPG